MIHTDSPSLALTHPHPDTQVSLERCLPVVKANGSVVRHCCPVGKKTPEELFQDELLKASGHADQVCLHGHVYVTP